MHRCFVLYSLFQCQLRRALAQQTRPDSRILTQLIRSDDNAVSAPAGHVVQVTCPFCHQDAYQPALQAHTVWSGEE